MNINPLIYFSSSSSNSHRFVQKLEIPAFRIPINQSDSPLNVTSPYILLTPSYGGGSTKGAVPPQVIRFLNIAENRAFIRGVIAAGNTNFGEAYGIAGRIISEKCRIPLLYRFELLGTEEDVQRVRKGIQRFWQHDSLENM
ncbi:class Ib ribonucleoside-diphosphate reductase assembly flavoprotein NrdI [Photorhabdus sp. HUG-39]|uniref:Protein NrdI n=1 Tax=Photorhabdus kayaii TaxID=230088 RepID=A0ABX0AX02_9GAMM|nr:class Ib ribonucleoside-diphosphate reductase assembly flavoprotein NrdI [Photorhabdus kayaii]NDL24004.1 class Ib ribonucleoside-diphosphate reductase assembly flavoprotein NrdI [Photorhabdus kayaii]RAX12100.1 class Ib ribonucleoside-diphosphate reductase assembly flavoprotein NrdI [Photorhabdus sp. HUG-39]